MRHLLLLGVLLAGALAGCDGSDSDEDESTRPERSTPARAEFVRQVDAVCEDLSPRLAEIMRAVVRARDAARSGRASLPETFEAFATHLGRAVTITDRFGTRLRAMRVPSSERAFYRELTGALEQGSTNLRQQVSAARARDAVRLRELSLTGGVINARAKGLLAGHGGFRFCGRG